MMISTVPYSSTSRNLLKINSSILGSIALFACFSFVFSGARANAIELDCNKTYMFDDIAFDDVIQCGDKALTIIDYDLFAGTNTIRFSLDGSAYSFDLDFVPDIQVPEDEIRFGSFKYKIQVTDLDQFIHKVVFSSDSAGSETRVGKIVRVGSPDGNVVASLNSSIDSVNFTPGYQTLYIEDFWGIGPNGTLKSLSNKFYQRVPGPIPILGLWAAFGWSRRLRNRVNHRKLPEVISAIG